MSEIKILIFISQIWSSGRYKQVVSKHYQSTIKDYIFHMEIYCILTRGRRCESSSSEEETSQITDTDFTFYQAFSVTTLAKTTCVQALVSKGLLFCRSPRWAFSPCMPLPALGPSHLDRGFWEEHALQPVQGSMRCLAPCTSDPCTAPVATYGYRIKQALLTLVCMSL